MNRRHFLKKIGISSAATAGLGLIEGCRQTNNVLNKSHKPVINGKRPNILWIMFDDGRADALGCYGRSWPKTSHMDALAANGVRFETAIVQNPVCVPSRRSMKTGFYAHQIGPVAMGKAPETPGDYLNASQMAQLDREPNLLDRWTAAGIQPANIGKIHGFPRSWKSLGDALPLLDVCGRPTAAFKKIFGDDMSALDVPMVKTPTHGWLIGARTEKIKPQDTETWQLGNIAVAAIDKLNPDEPFFLRVSFHAPHVGCYVPKEYFIDPAGIDLPLPTQEELNSKSRFEQGPLRTYAGGLELTRKQIDLCRGTYYGMVALADVQVGRMIEALKSKGLLENTIIAINSDQGFQLGEHGLWKKRVFYEANVKSPLILSCPALLPKGKVIDEPVEMIDFLPTLLELSGLDIPQTIRGRSLMPLIQGKVKKWRPACFSEIDHSQSMYEELRGGGRRVMVRTRDWKLIFFMDNRIADKDGVLYHLKTDPDEKINLYHKPTSQPIIKELEHLAQLWTQGEKF